MSDETRNYENEQPTEENAEIVENVEYTQENSEQVSETENEASEYTFKDSGSVQQAAAPLESAEQAQEPEFAQSVVEENSASKTAVDYSGGIAYTSNADGNVTNFYEWDGSNQPADKKAKAARKKSSDKGFRIFLGVMLTAFTASVITLTVLVMSYAKNYDNNNIKTAVSSPKTNYKNGGVETSESFDYESVTLDNPNYVAFDFKKYESGEALSIPEIAAKCSPSSVGIISEVEVSYNYPFYFGGSSTSVAEASGSGFVYSAEGYIITNHHVIEDASKVTVILHDGSELEAEIVGSDSLSDIAVLKVTPNEETSLIPMEIGNSDELVVGEGVVAIGCPAGIEFIGTVTDGIVSSINRNVEITDDYGTIQKTMTLIQTNATINHGNSGGPLINSRGQVVGINTLKLAQDYEGIGFSIPMNGAVPIISQLIEHGEVVERTEEDFAYGKGIIGINGSAISEDEAEYYNIPVGVLVVQIDKNGSAANAGLRRGDIITHYNGKEVKTVDDINKAKNNARPGTEVTLTVYRDGDNKDGETLDITFKLDSQE